jgi:predicted Zn-dependent protease
VASQPTNTAARNNLAWLYLQTGDGKAQSMAKSAYDQAPGSAAVADTYGWILLERGNTGDGLKILADAAARAPREPDIQYHYASALARTGARDEAVKRLTVLLKDFATFSSRTDAQNALNHLSEGTRSAS